MKIPGFLVRVNLIKCLARVNDFGLRKNIDKRGRLYVTGKA